MKLLPRRSSGAAGFTMLELMVGLILLAVGIVGFAGMVMMQAKGNQVARLTDEAATLVQSKIEDLSGIEWDQLGTDTAIDSSPVGLTAGNVWTEGPMNHKGEVLGTSGAVGPFLYYRSVVICPDGTVIATGSSPAYCGSSMSGSNRPADLSCPSGLASSDREKIIRVLVSWSDRNGKCHYKATDSIAFNWGG